MRVQRRVVRLSRTGPKLVSAVFLEPAFGGHLRLLFVVTYSAHQRNIRCTSKKCRRTSKECHSASTVQYIAQPNMAAPIPEYGEGKQSTPCRKLEHSMAPDVPPGCHRKWYMSFWSLQTTYFLRSEIAHT